jgi:hypothetical protein
MGLKEDSVTKRFPGISGSVNDLIGKKIMSISKFRAEFGRTYNEYTGFICDDGTRVLIYGDAPYDPNPPLEEMRKTGFFNVDEMIKKAEMDIREDERRRKESRERDLRDLEKLKGRLGVQ